MDIYHYAGGMLRLDFQDFLDEEVVNLEPIPKPNAKLFYEPN